MSLETISHTPSCSSRVLGAGAAWPLNVALLMSEESTGRSEVDFHLRVPSTECTPTLADESCICTKSRPVADESCICTKSRPVARRLTCPHD